LIVTAKSSDNVIQAMQHTSNPHYGMHFHPESTGTQFGMGLLGNFVKVVQEHTDKQKY
jgi:anthranilate/para-aminobenzoate synthase component II